MLCCDFCDDAVQTVKRNQQQYSLPLKIISYQQLYGWTMDAIVKEVGRTNNCTFCGVFRRQALDRGAIMVSVVGGGWAGAKPLCLCVCLVRE